MDVLHVSFCRYFKYLHFLYRIFFHTINIFRFISEKRAFCNYSIFFRIFFSQVSNLKHTHFFSGSLSKFLWKEMLVYNFFPIIFYLFEKQFLFFFLPFFPLSTKESTKYWEGSVFSSAHEVRALEGGNKTLALTRVRASFCNDPSKFTKCKTFNIKINFQFLSSCDNFTALIL